MLAVIDKTLLLRQSCAAMIAGIVMVFSTAAYSASKTVLVLGDSLSAEYGLVRGTGWVPLLRQKIQDENIKANIVNASISGETTSGGRARLRGLLNQHKPDIVVIELGGNDGLRGLPLKAMESNLRDMIEASRKASAKVLLVGMQIPPNYGRAYTEKFSSLYGELAKEYRIPRAPFFLEGIATNPELFQADGIHPASNAQPIMLNNIWPHLKPLLVK